MNQSSDSPVTIVAITLILIVTIACIAGALLTGAKLYPPDWYVRPTLMQQEAQNQQTALDREATVQAEYLRQTQIVLQSTTVPMQATLQAQQTRMAPPVEPVTTAPTGISIALAVMAIAAIALLIFAIGFTRWAIRKSAAEQAAAEALRLDTRARYLEAQRKVEEARQNRGTPGAVAPTQPIPQPPAGGGSQPNRPYPIPPHVPPFTDGGHKTRLDPGAERVWPDDEENKGRGNLPWVD